MTINIGATTRATRKALVMVSHIKKLLKNNSISEFYSLYLQINLQVVIFRMLLQLGAFFLDKVSS